MSEISIEPGAVVPDDFVHGDGCSIGAHALIGRDCVAEDHVRIGARSTVLAPEPSADNPIRRLVIQSAATIGAGAVVSGANVIGRGARIEPGAVCSKRWRQIWFGVGRICGSLAWLRSIRAELAAMPREPPQGRRRRPPSPSRRRQRPPGAAERPEPPENRPRSPEAGRCEAL